MSLPKDVLFFSTSRLARLDLADAGHGAKQSWMQIAKTGAFVSKRYGKFAITPGDLSSMAKNFRTVTPLAPTKLMVDYDHLSMDPKKPGDGIAAGWIQDLELREDGKELWGKVEWTPTAAGHITNKEYQFVSPSFVKDYTSKTGQKIGTTLLAAAVTNHPFLEGMKAIELNSREFAGWEMVTEETISLADVGQMVQLNPKAVTDPTLANVPLEVAQAQGSGDQAFVQLKNPADGSVVGWYPVADLMPAPGPGAAGAIPPGSQTATPNGDPNNPANPPNPAAPVNPAAKPGMAKPNPFAGKTPPQAAGQPGANTAAPNPAMPNPAAAAGAGADAPGVHVHLPQAGGGPLPHNVHIHMSAVGETLMKTFTLSDVDGKEVTLSEDALKAIAKELVPDGSVVIAGTDLEALKGQVTTLSSQVSTLSTAADTARKQARAFELTQKLDGMKGRITGAQRTYALELFSDAETLDGFDKWAAANVSRSPILKLDTEHGSGAGASAADADAGADILALAESIAKEKRIPFREAVIQASAQRIDASETYREGFALAGQVAR